MSKVAVGFRVHSGWTALVAVCLEKGVPVVLQRRRVHLVETFSYTFRQPYHTAQKMELSEARKFVSQVRGTARNLAYRTIQGLKAELEELGYQLRKGALLLASGRPLPELEGILASHALIHTADGELFRESLLHASERCGLEITCVKDKEVLEQTSKTLRLARPLLLRRATELGKPFGAPWSQDEKFAALAAWLALSGRDKNSPASQRIKPA